MSTKNRTQNSLAMELPPGSGIDEEESIESSEIIKEPFDPTLIRVEKTNPTVELVTRRIRYGEINLAPEFQRKGGIWSDEAQSRLIESLLIKIPLPAFYVDATNEDDWLVVDGLQRLTAFKRYIVDKGSFSLVGLEFLSDLEGNKFGDLPRSFQRRIEETELTFFQIQAGTPDAVKFNIFKRINTGGLPLSAQEIRNALNGPRVREFLARLSTSEEFLSATNRSIRDKRMADRECVIRFLSFSNRDPQKYSGKDFDGFLNTTMMELNDPHFTPDTGLKELEKKFYSAMTAAKDIFGKFAFRKYYGKNYRLSPINKALFEAWTVNLAELSTGEIKELIRRKDDLLSRLAQLMDDDDFVLSISQGTGAPSRVKLRFSKIKGIVQETLR